jgi:ribosomal protein S18 acetylase RimI-like enzyme
MSVLVRAARASDREAVQLLLVACGWDRPRIADPARFAELYGAPSRSVVAEDQGTVVGYVRAITDGVSNGYIQIAAVAPARRREGIGRRMVHHLLGDDDRITWVLRAGREGAKEFWESVGFVPSSIAMERLRRS